MQGLMCHFISMSGKSPTKLEMTSRHNHSCLLGCKASNQTKSTERLINGLNFLVIKVIFLVSENLGLSQYMYFVFSGLFFIVPCIDSYTKVDLRTVSFDVPPQEVGTIWTDRPGQQCRSMSECSLKSSLIRPAGSLLCDLLGQPAYMNRINL